MNLPNISKVWRCKC